MCVLYAGKRHRADPHKEMLTYDEIIRILSVYDGSWYQKDQTDRWRAFDPQGCATLVQDVKKDWMGSKSDTDNEWGVIKGSDSEPFPKPESMILILAWIRWMHPDSHR